MLSLPGPKAVLLVAALWALAPLSVFANGPHWPGFRGNGDSHSGAALPEVWTSQDGGGGVAWVAPLPGYGQSSPVVWGDRVYLTAVAGPRLQTQIVLAIDLRDGRLAWTRESESPDPRDDSDTVAKAAPTAAVDERGLYVLFESGDLLSFSHDGHSRWMRG